VPISVFDAMATTIRVASSDVPDAALPFVCIRSTKEIEEEKITKTFCLNAIEY